ncbi:MAG: hypothetical protein U1D25_03635 [Hydrogenophaga sp.]|uniref:hypothetical protein n=1 Tax=Hydrogenophaga sp. TaxID=1904254 RepID=UPI00276F15BC|nr:hypothetical protein [Hydrogenophaga sp.]MDP2418231.1 hypothetical protein [Hydrogenophaga sp.]MDZ4187192.1 hypothetical protein [Hydrogenophaga sp.]
MPRWPAGAVLLAGCVLGGMAFAAPTPSAAALNAADAANPWPRLFYTPAQRAALVRARYADSATPAAAPEAVGAMPEAPPPLTTFVLQGMAQGSQGASAWINGQMLRNGALLDGRTVHIEQLAVRLRQPGQPDLVLKPGQASLEPGQPVLDVVPAGTFIKR